MPIPSFIVNNSIHNPQYLDVPVPVCSRAAFYSHLLGRLSAQLDLDPLDIIASHILHYNMEISGEEQCNMQEAGCTRWPVSPKTLESHHSYADDTKITSLLKK